MDHSSQSTIDIKNILFYIYVDIKNPSVFRDEHLEFCKSLNLLGKVLVAKEGINGCLSGTLKNTSKYMEFMTDKFPDIEFKEGLNEKHTFKRMLVKVRKEIVALNLEKDVDMNNRAPYIEPLELKKLLESNEEVILLDARNKYESEFGHFENAITPNIETFRQFPGVAEKLSGLKDKKIVTYCTGGIRCEKASAYLIENGFTNVQQLHGGILNYGKECGNDHWKGKCFVFDHRGVVNIDPSVKESITQCYLCYMPTDETHNCIRNECSGTVTCCSACYDVLNHCCSKKCRGFLKQKVFKSNVSEPLNAQ